MYSIEPLPNWISDEVILYTPHMEKNITSQVNISCYKKTTQRTYDLCISHIVSEWHSKLLYYSQSYHSAIRMSIIFLLTLFSWTCSYNSYQNIHVKFTLFILGIVRGSWWCNFAFMYQWTWVQFPVLAHSFYSPDAICASGCQFILVFPGPSSFLPSCKTGLL